MIHAHGVLTAPLVRTPLLVVLVVCNVRRDLTRFWEMLRLVLRVLPGVMMARQASRQNVAQNVHQGIKSEFYIKVMTMFNYIMLIFFDSAFCPPGSFVPSLCAPGSFSNSTALT